MNLSALLRPLLAFDGLMAVMITTRDGLPVEMIGSGLRADQLAAEAASVAEAARRAFVALGMGEFERLRVDLPRHETIVFAIGQHHLVVIFEPSGNYALVSQIVEQTKPQLMQALGGRV